MPFRTLTGHRATLALLWLLKLRLAGTIFLYERIPSGTPLALTPEQVLEAREAADRVLTMAPSFTIRGWLHHIQFGQQADADRLAEGATGGGFAQVYYRAKRMEQEEQASRERARQISR